MKPLDVSERDLVAMELYAFAASSERDRSPAEGLCLASEVDGVFRAWAMTAIWVCSLCAGLTMVEPLQRASHLAAAR